MSFMGTLAKVAMGVIVAKGIGKVMGKSGGSAGSGGLFGGSNSPSRSGSGSGGGLEDMMGSILGGRGSAGRSSSSAQSGGLGGLLEGLAGGGGTSSRRTQGSGLDGLLGGLAGGGLGGILGSLAGGVSAQRPAEPQESFGTVLNQSLSNGGEPEATPTAQQDAMAALMLRAMIQAAKSDGKIDAAEKEKLLGNMGDVSQDEMKFVQDELAAPVDIEGLAGQVPKGLEAQVYTMSVMAIDLDSKNEAQYLHKFAGALGLGQQDVNHIHAELGIPALYA